MLAHDCTINFEIMTARRPKMGICMIAVMMLCRTLMRTQGTNFLMPQHTALQSRLFSRWHTPTPPVFHSENAREYGADPSKLWAFAAPTVAVLVTGYALCGRCQGLQKRLDVVRCQAGFEGSGLTGKWGCYKTEGDIDAYWKATGLPWLARKGLQLMDWGAGKNQNIREFLQDGDSIKMAYSFDGPGLGGLGFTETYTVGNGIQEITRMGGAKILVDPAWESDSVLRVQNMNPAKQTKGWAKTLISGGEDEETQKQMVDGETSKDNPLGDVIDVHRFYLEESSLVLEADSSPSGGPVVKWFLKKLT